MAPHSERLPKAWESERNPRMTELVVLDNLLQCMDDPPGITRDRYCSPSVTIETCYALFIVLEPLEDLRTTFMFWRNTQPTPPFKGAKPRLRDLRPGDQVVVEGWRRKIAKVEIYR